MKTLLVASALALAMTSTSYAGPPVPTGGGGFDGGFGVAALAVVAAMIFLDNRGTTQATCVANRYASLAWGNDGRLHNVCVTAAKLPYGGVPYSIPKGSPWYTEPVKF